MNLKEDFEKAKAEALKESQNAKFSSLLIKNNKDFYFNFHDNENKQIISIQINKNGNVVSKEIITEDFRPLKEEDELKEEDLEKIEDELIEDDKKEMKDFIISKKQGTLSLVEFDLTNQTIKEYHFKDKKEKVQELKFSDVFKMA